MTCCDFFQLIPSENLFTEDLILNAHILFPVDERPSLSSPLSPDVAEPTTPTYVSFWSPESAQPDGIEVLGSTTGHDPGCLGIVTIPTQRSYSSLRSDVATESRLTPSPANSLSPLLGLSSSRTRSNRVETSSAQEQVISEVRGTELILSIPPFTSVPDWWPPQPRPPPLEEPQIIAQRTPESELLSTPPSSATSLRTAMEPLSP